MPTPAVWTERESSGQAWEDCTYCSLLMVIVGSGFESFPLGIYTEAERHAFRAGDSRLNFAGGVDQARIRYGLTIVSPAPYSQSGLRSALSAPGRVYAVAGRLANFPAGHALRRWAPSFTGSHAVAVVPLGGARVLWLDPLAPNQYAGDNRPASDVSEIFAHYPNDARYMEAGTMAEWTNYRAIGEDWTPSDRGPAGNDAPLREVPSRSAPIVNRFPAGSPIRTIGEFEREGEDWRVTRNDGGATYFLLRGDLDPLTQGGDPRIDAGLLDYIKGRGTIPGEGEADCSEAVEAEKAKWEAWLGEAPN